MEGTSTGHTPGEISSVWGSTTAADVVGGGGGDRDTLGGCAVGKEVGARGHIRCREVITTEQLKHPVVGTGRGYAKAEEAITGHRRKGSDHRGQQ